MFKEDEKEKFFDDLLKAFDGYLPANKMKELENKMKEVAESIQCHEECGRNIEAMIEGLKGIARVVDRSFIIKAP